MAHCDMYLHVKINKHNSWHVRVFRWRSMMAMTRMRIRVRIIIRTIIIIFFIFIFIIIIIFIIFIFIFFFIIIFIFIFTSCIIITSLAWSLLLRCFNDRFFPAGWPHLHPLPAQSGWPQWDCGENPWPFFRHFGETPGYMVLYCGSYTLNNGKC